MGFKSYAEFAMTERQKKTRSSKGKGKINELPLTRAEISKRWRERNPEKQKAAAKAWLERNKEYAKSRHHKYALAAYGLTVENYNELLEKQNMCCAICKRDTPTGKWKRFCVDHCHKTGKVRGLLCNECNRGMGLLKDDPSLLIKAANYLKESEE